MNHPADTRSVAQPLKLHNVVQPYAWGSRRLLAELRGEQPSAEPEAEIWMGSHPAAPSSVYLDGELRPLDQLIAKRPELVASVEKQGARLPYLVKLLAAGAPLSLQAHPTKSRAVAGFDRENSAGIALDDPTRSYKDNNHKPELICALTEFTALSGFREPDKTIELFQSLACAELDGIVSLLGNRRDPDVLINVVRYVLTLAPDDGQLVGAAVAAALSTDGPFELERSIGRRIGETHRNDPSIVIALMLEAVVLQPGEAIYLGAGRLHTYISGLGVEIMAASDNVLRGGLTPKHIDIGELIDCLEPDVLPVEVLSGDRVDGAEVEFITPAPEFLLSSIAVSGELARTAIGPEIVVVTSGEVAVSGNMCRPTESVFIPAGLVWTASGRGHLFRARVGESGPS